VTRHRDLHQSIWVSFVFRFRPQYLVQVSFVFWKEAMRHSDLYIQQSDMYNTQKRSIHTHKRDM